jgi:hypothetical protein
MTRQGGPGSIPLSITAGRVCPFGACRTVFVTRRRQFLHFSNQVRRHVNCSDWGPAETSLCQSTQSESRPSERADACVGCSKCPRMSVRMSCGRRRHRGSTGDRSEGRRHRVWTLLKRYRRRPRLRTLRRRHQAQRHRRHLRRVRRPGQPHHGLAWRPVRNFSSRLCARCLS